MLEEPEYGNVLNNKRQIFSSPVEEMLSLDIMQTQEDLTGLNSSFFFSGC